MVVTYPGYNHNVGYGGLTLHAGRRNEFELAVQLGFNHPNSGSLGIALLLYMPLLLVVIVLMCAVLVINLI